MNSIKAILILFCLPITGWANYVVKVENSHQVITIKNFEYFIDSTDSYSIGNIENQIFTVQNKG
ncbi:MAG: hypothetical protein ACJAWO_001849, partial [Halieaceae bacterium]